ncbi:G-box-binding factor 1 isoform X2 [Selaginella moellendorffii]|uniref:G-box-binding factor 1 isoform X2 n=1 Tax=Selaginella moellendorffii TaxID=88036 RepID=UPI000D1CDFDB|nr:G-box-binding factor 1 isoform X2 [Selaginella moellendorffii]|eukprot:XP_024530398.1 G-box-binding factor 1 isoform X2 [Selaginella moellendorffii]
MGSGDAPPSSAKASKAAPPPPAPPLPPPPATSSQETHTPTSWPQGYYPPPPAPGGAPQAGYFPVWHGQHMQPMMYGHYAMYPHGGYPYGLAGMASPPGSGNDGAAEGKSSKSKKRKTKPEAAVDKAIAPRTEESDSDGSPSGNSDEDKTENKKNSSEQGTETTNGFQYTDFWNGGQGKQRASGAIVPAGALESDMMLQDERELKRQRRKQSNRESARRSRQRKQKECEELSHKVEDLTQDNERLKAQLADVQEIKRQLEEERDSYLEQLQALQQHGDSPKAAELHKSKQRDQQGSSSPIVQNNQQQHLPEIG